MSDLRTEHASREAGAWSEFERALDRVPRERWEEAGVLDGWTVKEMLWHMAGWLEKCADNLERFRKGAPESETDLTVDERNAQLASEAQGMTVDVVHDGLLAARALVRERWLALPDVEAQAIEELAGETYEHYDEHRLDLERSSG
jgi:hypothetical protein